MTSDSPFVFQPQIRPDAGQEPGQARAQLVQARWRRRGAEVARLPPFRAVGAVDDDARYGAEAADTEQRGDGPAGYHGQGRAGGPHVVQELADAAQRARIARPW